ncbi:MAG: hypothetical protein HRT74_07520 [Flavobacteriales bacterium]|nr:hypothetical protein [Flavobacteriales bacterium]
MKSLASISLFLCLNFICFCQYPGYSIDSAHLQNYLLFHEEDNFGSQANCNKDLLSNDTSCFDQFGEFKIEKSDQTEIWRYKNGWVGRVQNVDDQNLNHGLCTEFYLNSKQKFAEWSYEHGKFIGVKYFTKEGSLFHEEQLIDGNGSIELFRRNGTRCYRTTFVNYEIHGRCVYYYSSGAVMISGNCENGEMIGEWKEYDLDGNRVN